jgi:hypothetical protein
MNRGMPVRLALIAGLVLLVVVICVVVGAPMIDMIRAHLGM